VYGVPEEGSALSSGAIRINFQALARTNISAAEELPKNPRDGMLRILVENQRNPKFQVYLNGQWYTVIDQLTNPSPVPHYFEYDFASSDTWVVDHNLGRRPIVQVLNSSNIVVEPLAITHANTNRVIVTHTSPIPGRVVLIG
jgi:hypothetical protein